MLTRLWVFAAALSAVALCVSPVFAQRGGCNVQNNQQSVSQANAQLQALQALSAIQRAPATSAAAASTGAVSVNAKPGGNPNALAFSDDVQSEAFHVPQYAQSERSAPAPAAQYKSKYSQAALNPSLVPVYKGKNKKVPAKPISRSKTKAVETCCRQNVAPAPQGASAAAATSGAAVTDASPPLSFTDGPAPAGAAASATAGGVTAPSVVATPGAAASAASVSNGVTQQQLPLLQQAARKSSASASSAGGGTSFSSAGRRNGIFPTFPIFDGRGAERRQERRALRDVQRNGGSLAIAK